MDGRAERSDVYRVRLSDGCSEVSPSSPSLSISEMAAHPRETFPEPGHVTAPRIRGGGPVVEEDLRDEPRQRLEVRLVYVELGHLLGTAADAGGGGEARRL